MSRWFNVTLQSPLGIALVSRQSCARAVSTLVSSKCVLSSIRVPCHQPDYDLNSTSTHAHTHQVGLSTRTPRVCVLYARQMFAHHGFSRIDISREEWCVCVVSKRMPRPSHDSFTFCSQFHQPRPLPLVTYTHTHPVRHSWTSVLFRTLAENVLALALSLTCHFLWELYMSH